MFIEFRNFPVSIAAACTTADPLHAIEFGHGVQVADDRPQFGQALCRQVVLRLHDVVVGRHTNVEPRLFGFGVLVGRFARLQRRLVLLVGVLDGKSGVGDLRRDVSSCALSFD